MKLYKITAVLLLMGLLAGCANKNAPQQEQLQQTQPQTEQTTAPIEGPLPLEQTGIAVETPYFVFYYPREWEALTAAEVTESGENHKVSFRGRVGEKELEIFSFIIGPQQAEGYLLGMLDGNYVYSVMNEQSKDDWSEQDYIEICRQQEYINTMILQLHDDPGFTPS